MSKKKKATTARAVSPKEPVKTQDAFANPLFRLGYASQSPLEATEYPLTRMTDNYALLNSLYRTNWIVQNVVGIVPDDMCREWYKLTGDVPPEQLKLLNAAERRMSLRTRVTEGLRLGRLYGGAAGLLLIKGQEDRLEEPLDLGSVLPGSFAGIHILDRWCGITPANELVTEIGDPDYGLPAYYDINDGDRNLVARVHHSRIIRFVGRELPYLERLAELYWGESEIEAIYDDIVKHDNVSANMAALTFRANLETMEVQNLDQLFSLSSVEQQRRFWNVMQAQSVARSNFGMQLINKGDTITQHQYSFAGLRDVYESMCMSLSGATRIPMTKLFGRSPAGMNATGESDLRNYYDYIDSLRESKLRPALEKLLPVLCVSTWGQMPEDVSVEFPPLWTPTAQEVAQIAAAKTQAIIQAYQAGLLKVGAAQQELRKLEEDTGLYGSISDEEIAANAEQTYQDATALRDPLAGIV